MLAKYKDAVDAFRRTWSREGWRCGSAACYCVQKQSFDEAAGEGGGGGGGREREGEGFLEEMASSGTLKITIVPEEEGEMWKGPADNGNRKGWLSSLDLGRRRSLREK